ncbi:MULTISPECIES: hypothetical protein [unclassified Acinetobacter]|uniref:hypothetical protein n=1 Tax=unclassified Acinetobacter TaxID=196816 RepID=UPI0035BA43AF
MRLFLFFSLLFFDFIGLVYKDLILPFYAKSKIKKLDKHLHGCIYYDHSKEKTISKRNTFLMKSYSKRKVTIDYYKLNGKKVFIEESSHIPREKYLKLLLNLESLPSQCQNIEYVMVTYFNGTGIERAVYVYDYPDKN